MLSVCVSAVGVRAGDTRGLRRGDTPAAMAAADVASIPPSTAAVAVSGWPGAASVPGRLTSSSSNARPGRTRKVGACPCPVRCGRVGTAGRVVAACPTRCGCVGPVRRAVMVAAGQIAALSARSCMRRRAACAAFIAANSAQRMAYSGLARAT
eukprot:SAG11_NODE_20_length_25330_cov_18.348143_2_plen_153_part_00